MKTKTFRYLVYFLALVSIATDCDKKGEPWSSMDIYFTINPDTGPTNVIFTFDAGASYSESADEDGNKEKFYDIALRWDFDYTGEDDLLWDTEYTVEDIVTHVYTEAGTYEILLEGGFPVANKLETFSRTLVVTEAIGSPPVAAFTIEPEEGYPMEDFTMDASLSQDNEDPIEELKVRWDWEDDGTYDSDFTTEKLASHAYPQPGVYTIRLQVKDTDELTDEITQVATVLEDPTNACPGVPTVTDVDGNEYPTVQIGDQCWMKENLKTTRYNDETLIPNVEDGNAWKDLTTGAYVWYENDITWRDKYGALYNWFAVDDPKGLCPEGWHVPSKEEWESLISFIGGDNILGRKLRSCRQVNSPIGGECVTTVHPRWDATSVIFGDDLDEYGLSLLPGGRRASGQNSATFYSLGSGGYWWSTTYDSGVYFRYMSLNDPHIYSSYETENQGFSVRCIKNN